MVAGVAAVGDVMAVMVRHVMRTVMNHVAAVAHFAVAVRTLPRNVPHRPLLPAVRGLGTVHTVSRPGVAPQGPVALRSA